jgi:hypothetical protein
MICTRPSPCPRLNVRACAAPNPPPPPPPKTNPVDNHRQKAREALKNANERRVELEKDALASIAALQANIKQIVQEDIQLVKQLFNKNKNE